MNPDKPWLDMNVSTTIPEQQILTAMDRCDACGAQAYVRVEMSSGQLHFCGHHAAKHLPKLEEVALSIVDERNRIS